MSLPHRTTRRSASFIVTLVLAGLLSAYLASPSSATGTGAISGTIVDQNGAPAQFVRVLVAPPGKVEIASAMTDAGGHYTFSNLIPGSYSLWTTPPEDDWFIWPSQAQFDSTEPTVSAGATTPSNAVIARPAWLVVNVVDTLGNPLTGIGLEASVAGDPFACGRAVTHTPEPNTVLLACKPGGEISVSAQRSVGGSDPTIKTQKVNVALGEIQHATFTFPAVAKASGRITNSAGAPLSGVSLLGGDHDCSMGAGPTGSTGRFSVICAANTSGRYDVTTRSLSYIDRTLTVSVGTVAKNLGDIHLGTAAKARGKVIKNTGYSLTNGPCLVPYRWSGSAWVLNSNVKGARTSTTHTIGGARSGVYKFLATECYPDWGYATPSPTPSHERKWVAGGAHYAMKAGQTITLPTTSLRPAYNTTLSITGITPPAAAGGDANIAVRVVGSGTTANPTGTFGFEIQDPDGNGAVFNRSLPVANDGKLTVSVPNLAPGTYDVVVTFRGSYRFRDVRYPAKGTLIVP